MNFSIWSSYYVELAPEDMVCEFERNGIMFSELSDEHGAMLLKRGDVRKTGQEFKRFSDSHNVHFPQGHLWLECPLCKRPETEVIHTLENWLDLFYEIGIRRAVLHCDSESFSQGVSRNEKVEKNIDRIRKLCDYIKDTDMVICIENLYDDSITESADELLEIVHKVNSKNLGICLDTGHLNLTDKNQRGFIQRAEEYLKALHIADNDGTDDQHMMPFGMGNIEFTEVVQALHDIGYDGLFNYEIPGERHCPIEIKSEKLKYIKHGYNYLMKQAR